jgi:radical SAM superfamily enzyme YgiQ (UPF0313 family)
VAVDIVDAFAARLSSADAARAVLARQPTVVGLSCLTPAAEYTLALARAIKAARPDVIVALGNLHALFAEELLAEDCIDLVCQGEGEETILDLAAWARGEKKLEQILGVGWRNGGVRHNPPRPLISDLDALPFPDWTGLPVARYGLLPFATIERPALTVSGSRGCPYACSFCSLRYFGGALRRRADLSIVEELRRLACDYGARQVAFVDAYFPVTERQGMEFCDVLLQAAVPNRPVLLSQMRVDVATPPLMAALRRAGVRRVMFGLESGSQEVIDAAGKKFTVAQAAVAVRNARAAGVETVGFFIFGLPGDDPERARQTITFARSLPLDFAKFSLFVPFPGSAIYDALIAQNVLRRGDWRRFTTFNPDPSQLAYVAPGFTARELVELQHRANLAFYARPAVAFRLLFRVRTIPWRMVLAGMAALAGATWSLIRKQRVRPN